MPGIAILSLLWERQSPMLLHYLQNLPDTKPRTVIVLVRLAPNTLERIQAMGHRAIVLQHYPQQARIKKTSLSMLSQLHGQLNSTRWQAYCARVNIPSETTAVSLSDTVATNLEMLSTILALLDDLRQHHVFELILTSEDVMPTTRAAILWGKQARIPCLHIQHGLVIELFSVHTTLLADHMTVFGIQALNAFAPQDQHRISVVGNHRWDIYRQQQPNQQKIRLSVVQKYQLQTHLPMIVFATTAAGKLSAEYDQHLHEDTLKCMFRATRILAEQGVTIQLIIKERPSNVRAEKTHPVCARIARAFGFAPEDYTYTTRDIEILILSADILVACESSVNVEAMHAQTPTINLVTHFGLLRGSVFHAEDGIVDVCNNNPQSLAANLHRLLTDAPWRNHQCRKMHAHVPRYNVTAHHGNALDNVTHTIKQVTKALK